MSNTIISNVISHRSCRDILEHVITSEDSSAIVRSLPAQTVHLVINTFGAEFCQELIELVNQNQYRLLLDFQLWDIDTFNEQAFWSWLEAIDQPEDLEPIVAVINAIDPRLLAILVMRYVETMFFEETTEQPSGARFYTPDHGYTWVSINIEDPAKHRLLGRILAHLFQTDPDLFYKIISMPQVTTSIELEEGAYQDKSRRLTAEEIPSEDTSWEAHKLLYPNEARKYLLAEISPNIVYTKKSILPLVYDSEIPLPLRELALSIQSNSDTRDCFERGITFLMNCAMIRYRIPIWDSMRVQFLSQQLRGCINIGLEKAHELGAANPETSLAALGVGGLYRLGLGTIERLRSAASKLQTIIEQEPLEEEAISLLVAAISAAPPYLLKFALDESTSSWSDGSISTDPTAIEHISQLEFVENLLSEYLAPECKVPQTKI